MFIIVVYTYSDYLQRSSTSASRLVSWYCIQQSNHSSCTQWQSLFGSQNSIRRYECFDCNCICAFVEIECKSTAECHSVDSVNRTSSTKWFVRLYFCIRNSTNDRFLESVDDVLRLAIQPLVANEPPSSRVNDDDETCAVCMMELTATDATSDDNPVISLNKCGHRFHRSCIYVSREISSNDDWLMSFRCFRRHLVDYNNNVQFARYGTAYHWEINQSVQRCIISSIGIITFLVIPIRMVRLLSTIAFLVAFKV